MAENRSREQRHGKRLGEQETHRRTRIRPRTVLLASGVIDRFPSFVGRDECMLHPSGSSTCDPSWRADR